MKKHILISIIVISGLLIPGCSVFNGPQQSRPATIDTIDRNENYSVEGNSVFYQGEKIQGVDSTSFEILKRDYAKDHQNVYYVTSRIVDADPETFEVLDFWYAKDNNHVYYLATKIEHALPDSFEILNENYTKDAQNVFYVFPDESDFEQTGDYSFDIRIPGAMRDSFQAMDSTYSLYAKDNESVYYRGEKIPGAEPASFLGSGQFAKDNNHAYCNGERIPNADAESFEILNTYYARDQYRVYHRFTFLENLENADVESFETYDGTHSRYARDKNAVYQNGEVLESVDPDRFTPASY